MDMILFLMIVVLLIILMQPESLLERVKKAYDFRPNKVHGDARFAENKDLRRARLFEGKGIPIGHSSNGGHPLHYPGQGHILTVAAARTGKGATLIINALLWLVRSCIIFDPKGELAAISGHRRRRFGKVFVLNPFGILSDAFEGLVQARFNPMDLLDATLSSFHADCDKLAAALIWDELRDVHFITAARVLVSGVIAALIRHGLAAEKNLVIVARVISDDIFAFCRVTVNSTTDPFIVQKLKRFAAPGAKDSKEVMDVISTAITQLGFLANKAIAESLSGSDFRFSDLKRAVITVYICLPLNMLDVSSKYFRLLLETLLWDLLRESQGRRGKPVLAIIDEMAQLGPHIKSLENAMAMAAGAAGMQIWGILQDLSQLKGMFPETWETFIQNCGVTTWFGARDQTTREYVSKLSGTREVLSRARSVSIDLLTGQPSVSDSANQCARPLLLPHEVGQIANNQMIAFVEGVPCGPVLAKRKFYFRLFPQWMYRDNPYQGQRGPLLRVFVDKILEILRRKP